ncbi:TPA: hypothetical protein RJD49_002825 [Legionella pneumophila]|nr:hypothetical protein [Legionella pneumophila]HDV5806972.1 hypothetical protein [Legionella pneumophila]
MSALNSFNLDKLQISLHFQCASRINTVEPLKLKTQHSRLDFIQYCINQGKSLKSPNNVLDDYLLYQKGKIATNHSEIPVLSPADINRKKLSTLFAHLSAFSYDFGELTIEPIAVNDLIKKIQYINQMDDNLVSEYLKRLISDKIPDCEQIPLLSFLEEIQKQYEHDGVNFHCYLRENFLTDLKVENIKNVEPSLNYFMPSVFCQQHINSCEIATTMTMLKKVISNYKQMQEICLRHHAPMPQSVIDAQKKIKHLEENFQKFLRDPSSYAPKAIEDLHNDYLNQVEIIQVEMEIALKNIVSPEVDLFIKKNKNHTLATLIHLVATAIIPGGIDLEFNKLNTLFQNKVSTFQERNLKQHFEVIDKQDVVKNLHNNKAQPEEKNALIKDLKKLILFGKTKAYTESIACGHSLLMDIDGAGNLKSIEHKNSKAQETKLSQVELTNPNLIKYDNVETTLKSIESTLRNLYEERNNIVKIKTGVPLGSENYNKMQILLKKKDSEITDLLNIEKNLKTKHNIIKPEANELEKSRSLMNYFKGSIHRNRMRTETANDNNDLDKEENSKNSMKL